MNTEEKKETLEKELAVLHTDLEALGIQNPENKADWITAQKVTEEADLNLVADHTEEYLEKRSTIAQLETRYNNIRRALSAIENSTYGICEVCQGSIEDARLNANPAARTCILHLDTKLA